MALSARLQSAKVAGHIASAMWPRTLLTISYLHGSFKKPLLGVTIGQRFEEAVNKTPNKVAAIFPKLGKQYTFEQLFAEVEKLAAAFVAQGVRVGDRVGVWGPNTPEWLFAQFATARCGAVMVNVNPLYRANELHYALNKVGVSYLLLAGATKSQDFYKVLAKAYPDIRSGDVAKAHHHHDKGVEKKMPSLKRCWMMVDNAEPGTIAYSELLNSASNEHFRTVRDLQDKLQFDDAVNIQFTSGTTGQPKGATLTHFNILNNAYFSGIRMRYHELETRICAPVPFYHCFGAVLSNLQIATHNSTVIVPDLTFNAESTLQAIHKTRATTLYGTPTMFIDLLNHPNLSNYDVTSLFSGIAAGAPCPPAILRQMIDRLHVKDLRVAYGSTEISPLCTIGLQDDSFDDRIGTVGYICDHNELKLVDKHDRIVKIGTAGEVLSRGYNTMLGYWNDPEKTRESITESRWYRTGDIGVMDERGYLRISGRIKDMIIRGGENVYPAEVEKYLLAYTDCHKQSVLADVQVVGVPDDRLGETVCACVILKSGKTASAEQLTAFCAEQLARFKIPKYFLFMDKFPLTVTGKVQKFMLRKIAAEQLNLGKVKAHLEY